MRTALKLVLPLIISVALVSLLFAAYQVRTQRRNLRNDVARRAELLAESLQEAIDPLFDKNDRSSEKAMQRLVERFVQREHMKGIAVYGSDENSRVTTTSLGSALKTAPGAAQRSIQKNIGQGEFSEVNDEAVYFYAVPLERGGKTAGSLLVVFDASFINRRVLLTLRDGLLTALLETLLIRSWSSGE